MVASASFFRQTSGTFAASDHHGARRSAAPGRYRESTSRSPATRPSAPARDAPISPAPPDPPQYRGRRFLRSCRAKSGGAPASRATSSPPAGESSAAVQRPRSASTSAPAAGFRMCSPRLRLLRMRTTRLAAYRYVTGVLAFDAVLLEGVDRDATRTQSAAIFCSGYSLPELPKGSCRMTTSKRYPLPI